MQPEDRSCHLLYMLYLLYYCSSSMQRPEYDVHAASGLAVPSRMLYWFYYCFTCFTTALKYVEALSDVHGARGLVLPSRMLYLLYYCFTCFTTARVCRGLKRRAWSKRTGLAKPHALLTRRLHFSHAAYTSHTPPTLLTRRRPPTPSSS
jgi:hypothetical protein